MFVLCSAAHEPECRGGVTHSLAGGCLSADRRSQAGSTQCADPFQTTDRSVVRIAQPVTTATVEHILTNPIYAGYIVYRGEWIKTESEALIDREQWDQVQEIRKSRCLGITDPNKNFLLGILHDSQGRRMRTLSRARGYRYYRTQYAGWARKPHIRHVLVDANRVEALAKSILLDLLSARKHLKKTVLSLGLYSDEIKRLLGNGQLAARRLQLMDPVQLRHAFLAMVPRAEVSRTELRLYVSCYDVSRFLTWDGIGLFDRDTLKPSQGADRVELIRAPAFLVCGHPYFALPIMPCKNPTAEPDKKLVELLELAAELRLFVLANRTRSIRELASEKSMGPSHFARLLRINYLAPDIQAAIVDGTQPPASRHTRSCTGRCHFIGGSSAGCWDSSTLGMHEERLYLLFRTSGVPELGGVVSL